MASALVFTGIVDILGQVIDRIWPDKNEQDKVKLELFKLQQQGAFKEIEANLELAKSQASINQVEAAHENLFVAGWRPFIGWICGLGLCYQFLLRPLILVVAQAFGVTSFTAPELDLTDLLSLLLGMLGLSYYRTAEKITKIKTS